MPIRLDAARHLTCAGLDEGRKRCGDFGIMKSHGTYRMRESVDHAMDVHAGKAVISGPKNYLGNLYKSVPIGITVEGANILTRNMIIFGQGAIRCHPYLLDEMLALEMKDETKALANSTGICGPMSAMRRKPFSGRGGMPGLAASDVPSPPGHGDREALRRFGR